MATQTVQALVPGGKATAAPPLGPQLGPLGVNIGQVISEINRKTADFNGMQVPVKVAVDSDTKEFEIEVGTPPSSALILKEAGIKKGAKNPLTDKVADLRIEQIIKIAKMKQDNLLGRTLKERVKEIIGTCNSMGILVHGVNAKDAIKQVNEGKFDEEIRTEKTELTAEEMKQLEEEKKRLAEEIEKRREEFVAKGKLIISEMQGKTRAEIKHRMVSEGIPTVIIQELLPAEAKEGEAAAGAEAGKEAGAEGKEATKKEASKKESKGEEKKGKK